MSASLVGSEMCIRDSAWPVQQSRMCIREGKQEGGQARANARTPESTRAPVSYTHLTLPTICSV
eukprot:4309735-Alexandrium_andersonii.AAC.1